MSKLDSIPLHVLELFDYRTLTCLSTVNTKWKNTMLMITQKRNRTTELMQYIYECDSTKRELIIYEKLRETDAWSIFYDMKARHGLMHMRYVYVPCAVFPIYTTACISLYNPNNMHVVADMSMSIDSLPNIFGSCLFSASLHRMMFQTWNALYILWRNILLYQGVPLITWTAKNMQICKIDTVSRKIYASELYGVDSARNTDVINTYFENVAPPETIYNILHGLFS